MKVIKALVEYQIKIDDWAHEEPCYQTPDNYLEIVYDCLREADPMDYQNVFYDAYSKVKILSFEEVKTNECSSIQGH